MLDERAAGAEDEIILHPTSSRDVKDPFNWSLWRNPLAFAMLVVCESAWLCWSEADVTQFRKRPMYLASQLGHLGCVIWMVYINTEAQWLANKVLHVLFTSPIEMLIEVSIADMVSGAAMSTMHAPVLRA